VISYTKSLNMDLIITVVNGVGTINFFLATKNPFLVGQFLWGKHTRKCGKTNMVARLESAIHGG